jgi:hypothetical protein
MRPRSSGRPVDASNEAAALVAAGRALTYHSSSSNRAYNGIQVEQGVLAKQPIIRIRQRFGARLLLDTRRNAERPNGISFYSQLCDHSSEERALLVTRACLSGIAVQHI